MFNFTAKTTAATAAAPTTSNSTFTFSPSTISQPWNTFGTSSTSQSSIFGTGVQNTPTVRPFGNSSTSTTPANFTPTNFGGTSIFGTNQTGSVTQPTNVFGSNLTGTTVKFAPVSGQEIVPTKTNRSLTINIKLQCICAMKEYLNKSMDELRMEDYQSNRKFLFANSISGSTKFSPSLATFSTTPTMSNIFGSNNTITTTTSPFVTTTSTTFSPLGNLFNQPFPTVPATSTTPLTFGTSTAPTMNIFGAPTSTIAKPFDTTIFKAPATTSVFNSTTTTIPFNIKPAVTQSPFSLPTNTNTSTPSIFGLQPAASTSIFSQPTTATSSSSIAPTIATNIFGFPISTTTSSTTITPAFPFSNTIAPMSTATNIFGAPIATTATAVPIANSFVTQPTVPTTAPFSFTSAVKSMSNTNAPATTTASTFNPQLFSGLPVTQVQPAVTSSSSTILPQAPTQQQNTEQSISIIQQQFLAASLLDPYANRGKKDFTNINQIQVPTESAIISTLSTTTNTTTVTTSTPIPITLPVQSNFRKVSSSHSLVDVNFKLKPVSSSPTLNDDIKPTNQKSIEQIKSTLTGNFTDEEELVLLSRTKMSKLRLSNDIIDSSYQSDSIRSLYPLRRLAELEKLTNIPPPSSSTTTTVTNIDENRHVASNPHSTSSIIPKQSSSPIIQHKSNNNSQISRLPILTRDNYYMKPTISELKSLFNDKNQCILKQFTVGHEKYGSVTFYGQINIAGLNLDEIIEINRHEVIVYPDDNNKPSIGEGLNLPARITLLGVYPLDRTTREEITDIQRIKAANYNDYLRELTKKFDGEFINYGINDGSWTFMVKHFTRYGLDDNQDDFNLTEEF